MADILIVGASARAAAGSAIRAGLTPWCADLFLDSDLRAISPTSVRCPLDRYPQGFVDLLREAPAVPWIYTGGLENHPEVVAELAAIRPLWGNGPEALRRARSPWIVLETLLDAGLLAPDLRRFHEVVPVGRWLRKPLSGAGGRGISETASGDPQRPGTYLQQFIDGTPMSAAFVRGRGETRLLGVTEQLIGTDWLNAPTFGYAGNIGPVPVAEALRAELDRVGRCLGDGCGLIGLFGVDFILADGRPWVIEVNPRYTASIEVIERATGSPAVTDHRAAFDESAIVEQGVEGRPWQAKAILYAPHRLKVGGFDDLRLADLPSAGGVVEAGSPVLTCFAEGDDRFECVADLRKRVAAVARIIEEMAA